MRMFEVDIPREQVLQARIARKIITEYQQLDDVQRAFLKLSADPQYRDYEYNLEFLENYTQTYWRNK